jgi:hypothetical protein
LKEQIEKEQDPKKLRDLVVHVLELTERIHRFEEECAVADLLLAASSNNTPLGLNRLQSIDGHDEDPCAVGQY